MNVVVLEHSALVAADVEKAFDTLLPVPLEQVFDRRFLLIAPVVGTDQDGVWGTVGQTRTVRQSDGGRMREELVSVERPHSFGYTLRVVRGPLTLVAGPIEGEWRFEEAEGGTRITWTWRVEPATVLVAPLLVALRPLWNGFARSGFERIAALVA